MPGPIPRSKEQNLARGNPGKRGKSKQLDKLPAATEEIDDSEELLAKAPIKPFDLDKDASEHWDYLSRILLPKRLLCELDGPALQIMCRAYSKAIRAERELDKKMLTRVSGGGERVSGYHKIAKEAWSTYDKFLDKFGMTPIGRAKMHISPPKIPGNGSAAKEEDDLLGYTR